MSAGGTGTGADRVDGRGRTRFTSREIALLGLMAALWGVIEITVGGMIKSWHVPFGGSFLSTFGVVILLTARASVPGRWSSLLVGIVAAGIRLASGFGGAMFAAIGIVAEAVIVEVVLSLWPLPRQRSRMLAGILAVLWALAHPFLVQGYLAGLGPSRVYSFTIGLIAGHEPMGTGQAILVIFFLVVVHIALGVSAVLFVDRILLAPSARARGIADRGKGGRRGPRPKSMGDGPTSTALVLAVALALAVGPLGAAAGDGGDGPGLGDTNDGGGTGTGDTSDAPPKPLYALPEITVFGSRLFGHYSVFTIDAGEIHESGAEDLGEALEMVPGMVVRTDARGEQRLSTRGLTEREMVVLVDGVPISDSYTGSVSSGMVLSGALEAVRVTKGPVASVYGANSLGGVIEVTTAGRGRTGLGYRLATGSDGSHSGFVTGGGRIGPVHLAGGVAANSRSDFSLPGSYANETWEDGGRRDYSGRNELFAWGHASWEVDEHTDASVAVQVADGRRDVPASTSSDRPRFWRFPFWREVRTVGSLNWRPDERMLVEGKLFYGTSKNQLASYSDPERTHRRWLSSVSNHAYGGYVYSEFRGVDGHKLSAGLNVREDVAGLQSDVGQEWRRYESTTMSLFGQDVVRIGDDDRVALAVNTDLMAGEDRFLVSVSPQAAWTRRLPAGMSLRLLGGLKTRFPTLKEWFSPEIGNPDLEPERCTAIEAEISKRTLAGSTLSLIVYEQWVKDMIVSSGWGDPAENLGAVNSWGAELGVEHSLSPSLDIDLSLAMTSARDGETNRDVPLVPKTMSILTTTYSRGAQRYIARLARVGPRSNGDGTGLPPHVLVDLRGILDTRWGSLFAGVENLFDVLYEDEIGFPQSGRAIEFGIMRDLYQ